MNSIQNIINVAYKEYSMIQNPIEIEKFSEFFNSLKCKNILEIGTFLGGTFYVLCKLSDINGKKISIDCPDVIAPGSDVVKTKHLEIDKYLVNFAKDVTIIRHNSTDPKSFEKLEKELNGELLDFIFIDGDHTYDGVKNDFNNYKKYLKDGGYIAFHDIGYLSSTVSYGCEVYKFWNELKTEYNFIEFNQGSFGGIGLVQVFKHKRKVKIKLEYESPNKINFINEGEIDFRTKVSIRDRDTKIPIYFCNLHFVQNCPIYYIIPLINYNFNEDENFSGFLIEYYDDSDNLIDSGEIVIKDRKTEVSSFTRLYSPFDCLFINYKQFFYDKIYDQLDLSNISTVIDIGANVGLFSNYISLKDVKLIHCIEPYKKSFLELKNQFYYYNSVRCHNIGIHYFDGKSKLYIDNTSSILNTFLKEDSNHSRTESEEVTVMTLPSFLKNVELNNVDLIKIDIEGLEYEVFNSLNDGEILKSKSYIVEYHINDDNKSEILQNRFKSLGYSVQNFPDKIDFYLKNNINIQGFFFARKYN